MQRAFLTDMETDTVMTFSTGNEFLKKSQPRRHHIYLSSCLFRDTILSEEKEKIYIYIGQIIHFIFSDESFEKKIKENKIFQLLISFLFHFATTICPHNFNRGEHKTHRRRKNIIFAKNRRKDRFRSP